MLDSGQILNSDVSFPLEGQKGTESHLGLRAEGELEGKDGSQLSSLKTRGLRSPLQKLRIQNEVHDTGLSQFDLQVNKDILVEGERKQNDRVATGKEWAEERTGHTHAHTCTHTAAGVSGRQGA